MIYVFWKKKKILIYVVALGGIEPVKEVGRWKEK
jgi:hypothetical protein